MHLKPSLPYVNNLKGQREHKIWRNLNGLYRMRDIVGRELEGRENRRRQIKRQGIGCHHPQPAFSTSV